jgi:ankyrin repeat protein
LPDTRDKTGETALFKGSSGGFVEVVKALIAAAANISIPDYDSFTPLHQAGYSSK